METQNFKWWLRLHSFWLMLPNFNPYTVTSGPGQDLAGEAYSVLMGGRDEHHSMNLARMLQTRHQREREQHQQEQHWQEQQQQQHQLCMLQMQMMMTQGQNQQVFPTMVAMMQPPNQPPLDGFSLMPNLGEAVLPSGSSSSLSSLLAPYSV
jgi:hypothetical protein